MAKKLIIIGIFLLAFFLRIWNISKYPVSISMDEAAFGYNAYSILKTGRDEFGEFLPLAFRSAGDYKPPVDVYLMVPFVWAFGLNEFSIRLPIALLGSLTVISFIYLLISFRLSRKASYLGGIWLAISPWHIYYSRGGVGSISSLFFLITGVLFFTLWVKRKEFIYPIISAIFLSLSVWAYHAERLFIPLLTVFLIFLFKPKKKVILFIIVTLIFAIPFIKLAFFTPAISQRASVTSILSERSLVNALHNGNYQNLKERIFDNDIYLVYRHWLGKYLNYYDLRFWFWKGLQLTPTGYPDLGLLMVIDLPLIILGIYSLIKSKNTKLKYLSLFWFFAGPFPASLTMNEQHPLRALVWLPFFGIIITSGFEYLLAKFKLKKVLIGYLVLALFNFIYFFDIYINQFPRFYSEYWQYGYKQVAIYACNNKDKYDEIVISDTFGSDGPLNSGLPYLYMLTFCDWDRQSYLVNGKHQDKIRFRRAKIEDFERNNIKTLIIGSPWDFVGELKNKGIIIDKIQFKNGKDAFWFVES
jgi:4-amino-4-deoxy-L-arabinose transferase-like glycosyltransferase